MQATVLPGEKMKITKSKVLRIAFGVFVPSVAVALLTVEPGAPKNYLGAVATLAFMVSGLILFAAMAYEFFNTPIETDHET